VLRRSGARRGRRRAGLVALVVAALVVVGTASALGAVRAFFLGTGVNSKIAFVITRARPEDRLHLEGQHRGVRDQPGWERQGAELVNFYQNLVER